MNPKQRSMSYEDAVEIRTMYKAGKRQKEIAAYMTTKLGAPVAIGTIGSIVAGRTYLPKPSPFKYSAGGAPRTLIPYAK